MRLATKTLAAIEAEMVKDQGARYKGLLRQLMPLAEDAYNDKEDPFRSHLGASIIGKECAREIWGSFRWFQRPSHKGATLRLFNRGHLEEPRMIALLMLIGCKVWFQDGNGKQFRIHGYRGHYGGGIDGVGQGIPDLPPDTNFLTEYKTHGDKSFNALIEKGVLQSKWEHFVQMQQYMGYYNLTHALYCAVNKNTDELHMEIIEYDPTQDKRYQERARIIVDSRTPPQRINNSPAWYKCKFCDQKDICHGAALPEKNCRTCRYVRVEDGGKWSCQMKPMMDFLNKQQQMDGCGMYEMIPQIKE